MIARVRNGELIITLLCVNRETQRAGYTTFVSCLWVWSVNGSNIQVNIIPTLGGWSPSSAIIFGISYPDLLGNLHLDAGSIG